LQRLPSLRRCSVASASRRTADITVCRLGSATRGRKRSCRDKNSYQADSAIRPPASRWAALRGWYFRPPAARWQRRQVRFWAVAEFQPHAARRDLTSLQAKARPQSSSRRCRLPGPCGLPTAWPAAKRTSILPNKVFERSAVWSSTGMTASERRFRQLSTRSGSSVQRIERREADAPSFIAQSSAMLWDQSAKTTTRARSWSRSRPRAARIHRRTRTRMPLRQARPALEKSRQANDGRGHSSSCSNSRSLSES
jgi:hypothetical protein